MTTPYDRAYLEEIGERTARSARTVVPGIIELLAPRSVVDIGCGTGGWLAAFRAAGVTDILGIDGPWIDRSLLEIPEDRFAVADLIDGFSTDRTFDLALSLEVAEHLPAVVSEQFVDSLVALAPAVLFSAAVPGQGGVDHINEQWQEVWAEKFRRRGYAVVDAVRPVYWDDESVEWWYSQNTLLYVTETLTEDPRFASTLDRAAGFPLSVVHPRLFDHALRRERSGRIHRAARTLRGLAGRK